MEAQRQTINMVSWDLLRRDPNTKYDISNGDKTFILKMSRKCTIAIQAIWDSLDAADGTLKVYGSNDGDTFDLLSGESSKTMSSTPSSWSFIKDLFNWEYIAVEVAVGSNTAGNLGLTLEIK